MATTFEKLPRPSRHARRRGPQSSAEHDSPLPRGATVVAALVILLLVGVGLIVRGMR